MNKDTGGSAFPQCSYNFKGGYDITGGMTLRQYAAIKLKVPNSGTDWLDIMIRESLEDDFAAKAMQGFLTAGTTGTDYIPDLAYRYADAMLKAREQ